MLKLKAKPTPPLKLLRVWKQHSVLLQDKASKGALCLNALAAPAALAASAAVAVEATPTQAEAEAATHLKALPTEGKALRDALCLPRLAALTSEVQPTLAEWPPPKAREAALSVAPTLLLVYWPAVPRLPRPEVL